jgi:hypothetical protein
MLAVSTGNGQRDGDVAEDLQRGTTAMTNKAVPVFS